MEIGVAEVYARALFDAATELGSVDEIKEELVAVDQIITEHPDFRKILRNPSSSRKIKKEMLRNVFEGKIHPELLSFIFILTDKNRGYNLHRITRQYCKMVDDAKNIGEGEIYSAKDLSPEQIQKFESETEKLLRKKIRLTNIVDASLIGGVKIFVDGKMIDASISSRLEELTERIIKVR